jgi:cellulose synthase/poly-beta-1,6-N-acetylglucosamine synthase-like glycosyltransferase
MRALFLLCLIALGYTYAGYPLLMIALGWLRPRSVQPDPKWRPMVSVVIAARDEAAVLGAKLESVLAQRWPRSKLEVIVADDGSRDGTAGVAAWYWGRGVRRVALPAPAGKAVAIDAGVAHAECEVLVFTDARQPLEPDALRWLVAPLADPSVGAVSGELHLDGRGRGLGLYRRLDDAIRRAEAASGSSVGVTGALWAMRRADFTPMPAGTILDDLHQPLLIARRGLRVVVAPEARVRDTASPDPSRELRRRTRTLAGNLQLVRALPWTLSPTRNPLFFRLLSHKLLRLAAPLWLALLALTNLALVVRPDGGTLAALTFAGQVLLYGAAAIDVSAPARARWRLARWLDALSRACRGFVLLHVAAVCAVWTFARHHEERLWRDAPTAAGRPGREADG